MMGTNRTASSLFLTSDLIWREHARVNVERETRAATLLFNFVSHEREI